MAVINKFHNSKIYTIRSPSTDKYYIGSTTQILCKRFVDHKSDYKLYLKGKHGFTTSYKIIELGDSYIELLEEFNCENRMQLERKEGELIRKNKLECVNRYIAGRTQQEYYIENKDKISEYKNQWYNENMEKIIEYKNQWYIDNKARILEQQKSHYINNKDKIVELRKQYNKDNKDKISEQRKQFYEANKHKINEPFTCECGSIIQHVVKSRHNKTKKHIAFINTIIV